MRQTSSTHNPSEQAGSTRRAALAIYSVALSALWLCSCTAPLSTAATDPFLNSPELSGSAPAEQLAGLRAPQLPQAVGRAKVTPSTNQNPIAAAPIQTAELPQQFAPHLPPMMHQAGYRGTGTGGILPVGHNEFDRGMTSSAPSDAVIFTPAEPRNDIRSRSTGVQTVSHEKATSILGLPDYPDEYLLDGGDRNFPLHREAVGYSGLDTEDTIADYTDNQGKKHILPSNRVAIYSPRFSAIRSFSGPEAGVAVDTLASAADHSRGVGMRTRLAPTHHSQRVSTDGVRMRSRASGLEAPSISEGLEQHTYASEHVKLLNAFQDLHFIRRGEFLRSEEARLSLGIQNAIVWNREEYPVATASITAGNEVVAHFKPQELVGVEDRSKPGTLRIVKLADRDTALPGEIVTFTIRYDNLGDHELQELTIIDNLTPRLEYVKESANSDRDARLDVSDNGEGSSVLTLKLKDILPGHEGGVLTFQARVR